MRTIALFTLMSEPQDLREEHAAFDNHVALVTTVVTDDPSMNDAWIELGNTRLRAERHAETLHRFSGALPPVFGRTLTANGRFAEGHSHLLQAELAGGDLTGATESAHAAARPR